MYQIINVNDYSGGIAEAASYFHSKWGNEGNFMFYLDAMLHSSNEKDGLPRFYLLLKSKEIVGCYALIVNDFISRHDLMPWFASLFIEEHERGKKLSQRLFDHAVEEARRAGFATLYLTTDREGLYEKFGWERIEDDYDLAGEKAKIYKMSTSQ
jgi:N-acetylglutamate synthase-like GNAT family acetyltransferase